jgi:DNA modification methylase
MKKKEKVTVSKVSVKKKQIKEVDNCCYFYKKNRRDYVPVDDNKLNELAKKKLTDLYKNSEKYNIPKKFKKNWDNIALFNSKGHLDSTKALYIKDESSVFELSNSLNELTSKEWMTETVTVFTQKGLGAGSKDAEIEKLHPAPFSFQDVARLIKFFTKSGDTVLDPFAGVGSTMKACAFEDRKGIGFELNPKYVELCKKRISMEVPDILKYKHEQKFYKGDCRKLISKLEKDSIDFVITSPPYWYILETVDHKVKENRVANNLDIKYSESKNDLGNIKNYNIFIEELSKLLDSASFSLKNKKYMVVIVSDFRKKEKYHIFHADLANAIESLGNFKLKGIKILHQKFKSIYPYGYPYSFVPNVHHQNVLIFQKLV